MERRLTSAHATQSAGHRCRQRGRACDRGSARTGRTEGSSPSICAPTPTGRASTSKPIWQGGEGNAAAVEAAVERFGGLDAVVANAGFQHVAPIEEFPDERWDQLLAVLLTSPFLLAKHAWGALGESGDGRFSPSPRCTASSPLPTRRATSRRSTACSASSRCWRSRAPSVASPSAALCSRLRPDADRRVADRGTGARDRRGSGAGARGRAPRAAGDQAPARTVRGRRDGRVPARAGRPSLHRRAGREWISAWTTR